MIGWAFIKDVYTALKRHPWRAVFFGWSVLFITIVIVGAFVYIKTTDNRAVKKIVRVISEQNTEQQAIPSDISAPSKNDNHKFSIDELYEIKDGITKLKNDLLQNETRIDNVIAGLTTERSKQIIPALCGINGELKKYQVTVIQGSEGKTINADRGDKIYIRNNNSLHNSSPGAFFTVCYIRSNEGNELPRLFVNEASAISLDFADNISDLQDFVKIGQIKVEVQPAENNDKKNK